jgi:hypothetical protein
MPVTPDQHRQTSRRGGLAEDRGHHRDDALGRDPRRALIVAAFVL